MKKESWLRRRWFEFRTGHSIYFVFIMGFSNFVLILYNFGIEPYGIDINFYLFTLLFLLLYIPISISIGRQHIKRQYKIELPQSLLNNPVWIKHIKDTELIKKKLNIK